MLYNCICSRVVPEVIAEKGGVGVRTKVGHSFIKQVMAETGAIFGGEHSAHYYFAGNYRADSGLIAAMHVLPRTAEQLTQLVKAPQTPLADAVTVSAVPGDRAGLGDIVQERESEHRLQRIRRLPVTRREPPRGLPAAGG